MTENQSLRGIDFREGYIAVIDKPLGGIFGFFS